MGSFYPNDERGEEPGGIITWGIRIQRIHHCPAIDPVATRVQSITPGWCCQINANWFQLADEDEISNHAKLTPLSKSSGTV
jgi:hypothetical protein